MRAQVSPDSPPAAPAGPVTDLTAKSLTRRAYVDLLRTASAACRTTR